MVTTNLDLVTYYVSLQHGGYVNLVKTQPEMNPSGQQRIQGLHVYQGIHQVMAAFSEQGIGKNSKNESQGFKFRGIDDVLNRLSKHLVEANLVIIPQVLSRDVHERTNARGNALFYVTLNVAYTIKSAVDGSETVVVTVGEAMDSGDKATNKALSIAYKYMAFQLFAIPIDEDPDKHTHEVKGKAAAPVMDDEDEKIISKLLDEAGMSMEELLGIYKVLTFSEIPKAQFATITSKLQQKIKSKGE